MFFSTYSGRVNSFKANILIPVLWGTLVLVCGTCGNAISMGADVSTFDFAKFDKLPKTDRLQLVLAGLREHDGMQLNADFTITEVLTNTPPIAFTKGVKRTSEDKRLIRLKTLGEKYYCEISAVQQISVAPGTFETKLKIFWDGQNAENWVSIKGHPWPSGIVDRAKIGSPDLDQVWWYVNQLGMRRDTPSRWTTADLIEDCVNKKGCDYSVQSLDDTNGHHIRLSVDFSDMMDRQDYVIDPDKQFVLIRQSRFVGQKDAKPYLFFDATTDQVKKVNGVWIPSRVTRNVFQSDGYQTMSAVFELTDCKLGEVQDSDFTITFEPGTHVIDKVKERAYNLGNDGSVTELPYYNQKTGKVRLMPTTRD